jgi:ribosomal protein S4
MKVKAGQVIKVKENKVKKGYWSALNERIDEIEPAGWLAFDKKELTITINSLPSNDEMPKNIETQLIIEFYSR